MLLRIFHLHLIVELGSAQSNYILQVKNMLILDTHATLINVRKRGILDFETVSDCETHFKGSTSYFETYLWEISPKGKSRFHNLKLSKCEVLH